MPVYIYVIKIQWSNLNLGTNYDEENNEKNNYMKLVALAVSHECD